MLLTLVNLVSTHLICLDYGRHAARLRHRRRRAYAPTSNTASHDNHEKINLWVSFSFPYAYGAPLGGPSDRRSFAMKLPGSFSYKHRFRYYCAFWNEPLP